MRDHPPHRLLITGTPGVGKRPLGNYLAEQLGFVHLDFEGADTRARYLGRGGARLQAELASLERSRKDVVVTWSVATEEQLESVELLGSLGFTWLWCDSDCGATCQALLVGAGVSVPPPRLLEMFDRDGTFRPLDTVAAEALEPAPAVLPRVERRTRSRGGESLRRGVVGALAFAAAAVAALGAYLGGSAALRQLGSTPAPVARAAALPVAGVLVNGESLGGVELGDSPEQVRSLWGRKFERCAECSSPTWLYVRSDGNGAAVRFRAGEVAAVYTLGMPVGWRTEDGLRVGQLLETFNDPDDPATASTCGARSTHEDHAVTSILTFGQAITGFALTSPSEPVCLT